MNNQLAYFDNNIEIYWHGIVMALAIALGTLAAAWFIGRVRKDGLVLAAGVLAAAFLPAVLLARAMYLFFADAGGSFFAFTSGGYALYGGILGVVLAAILIGKMAKDISASVLMDCLAPAGAVAIAIGRFAAGFSGEELGQQVDSAAFQAAPFATQAVDGNWYLSVYFFEGIAALAIAAALTLFFLSVYKKDGLVTRKSGTVAMLGAILYTASQCVLESMRTDLLFLKPFDLGFVKTSQIISAIILAVAAIILGVRIWKLIENKVVLIVSWAVMLGGFAAAFMMEFTLVAGIMVRNYTIMALSLAAFAAISIFMLMKTTKEEREAEVVPHKAAEPRNEFFKEDINPSDAISSKIADNTDEDDPYLVQDSASEHVGYDGQPVRQSANYFDKYL